MLSHHYLVEMSFTPFGSLLSPQEAAGFAERFVLPTLESCQKLMESGHILAGGPALAAVGLAFIARASSPQELEDMVANLPLWTRAQTRVVPLGSFDRRAAVVRERLLHTRSVARPEGGPTTDGPK